MKRDGFAILILMIAFFLGSTFGQTVKQVGDDQPTLKKLKDVASEVNSGVTDNTVYQLNASYDGTTGETFPIVFTNSTLYTVSVYVDSAATARVTSGSPGIDGPLLLVDGGGNMVFDGRPGGNGTSREWSIQHTNPSTAYPTIQIINGASNVIVRYLDVQGSNSGMDGIVSIAGGSGSSNNNTIHDNVVGNFPGGFPARGITCRGGSTSVFNANNTIANNEIVNIFSSSAIDPVAGIWLENSAATVITGNDFYWQDDFSSSTLGVPMYGIVVSNPILGIGSTITGNDIGGSAVNAGGAQRTFVSSSFFSMIDVENDVDATTEISGNTIANLEFTTSYLGDRGAEMIHGKNGVLNVWNNSIGNILLNNSSGSSTPHWRGIRTVDGTDVSVKFNTINNIGIHQLNPSGMATLHSGIDINGVLSSLTVLRNTICNIAVTTTGPEISFSGIFQGGSGAASQSARISANVIEHITQSGGTAMTFNGIVSDAGTSCSILNEIDCNRIDYITSSGNGTHYGVFYNGGAPATAPMTISKDTIQNWTLTGDGLFIAMESYSPFANTHFTSNLISNITMEPSFGDGTHTSFVGIFCPVGRWAMVSNTIANVYSTSTTTNGVYPAIKGIHGHATDGDNLIEGNVLYNFRTNPFDSTTPVTIQGIIASDNGSGEIRKNILHTFISDNPIGGVVTGIFLFPVGTNTWTISNNMVSLGVESLHNLIIRGIYAGGLGDGTDYYYYNTVLIGGSPVTGGGNTAGLERFTPRAIVLRNNILYSNREGGTGDHCALMLTDSSGWNAAASDYNDLYAVDSSTVVRSGGSTFSLPAWRSLTGGDAFSKSRVVNFLSTTDLHLAGASIGDIEFTGTPIGGITTDIDNQTRDTNFPTMGADEHPESPLPITLATFTAQSVGNGNDVLLQWSTVTEINNYGFYIERKAEQSVTFETVSGLIPGAGTTLEQQTYSWTEYHVAQGTYVYRLRQMDLNGDISYSYEIMVTVDGALGVDEMNQPLTFKLQQNYPNPFNPTTTIAFSLASPAQTSLKIFTTLGQEVVSLVNEYKSAGRYIISWNAANIPSGIYLMKLVSGPLVETRRMMLLK